MYRLFAEHALRPVSSLDGLWDMEIAGKHYPMLIPGVWERIPELRSYRGTAEFTRSVTVEKAGAYLLRFGGVSHTATVYWDGVQVGWHYNAYTAFEVRYETGGVLHFANDYYTYGGLNRPVEMHQLAGARITRMQFSCVQTGEGAYRATVEAHLQALTDCDTMQVTIRVADGRASANVPALRRGEETAVTLAVDVSGVKAWDIGQGHLYDLTATLTADGRAIDDLIDRVGFRTVEIAGQDILLNGRKIFIKGFNRHEDHGQFGSALPVEAMMDDLQLLLSTGANSLRTSHYPNDPRFLDLCDALGVLVWEEHHARGLTEKTMREPDFEPVCMKINAEMVHQHLGMGTAERMRERDGIRAGMLPPSAGTAQGPGPHQADHLCLVPVLHRYLHGPAGRVLLQHLPAVVPRGAGGGLCPQDGSVHGQRRGGGQAHHLLRIRRGSHRGVS